jgi:hypothetical protein
LKEAAHLDEHTFVNDAKRVVLASADVMEEHPLQTYCSALVFTPLNCPVREQFLHEIPSWITRLPEFEEDWSASVQTFEGASNSNSYSMFAFSLDGHLVVSNRFNIRFLDSATGASTGRIQVTGSYYASSHCFSRDGKLLACSICSMASGLHDVLLYDTVCGSSVEFSKRTNGIRQS